MRPSYPRNAHVRQLHFGVGKQESVVS